MSELLQKEDIEDIERWRTPEVQGEVAGGQLRTVAQLEALEKQAYDEGFARGYSDGEEAGSDEMQLRGERLQGLIEQLNTPFEALDEAVESELCELTFAIARQLIRREIKTSPGEVIGAVRAALSALPVACRNVRVQLHPDDAALVRDAMTPADDPASWKIIEEPMLTRGGCRVLTDTSQIDASVERRLGAAINTVLGDERGSDADGEDGDGD